MFKRYFSLIEMLTMVGILIVLIGLLTGASRAIIKKNKITTVKNDLRTLNFLVEEFYQERSYYPSQLFNESILTSLANYLNEEKNNLRGKNYRQYLSLANNDDASSASLDSYGTPYQYIKTDINNPTLDLNNKGTFDLWSHGEDVMNNRAESTNADGSLSNGDDIGNWEN